MAAEFELSVTRHMKATPEQVYRTWTQRTKEWWCPLPWTTTRVEHDLRPGGRAFTEMRSPEGQLFPYEGVFLEVIPNEKIVTTSAIGPDWTPKSGEFDFIALWTFEPEDGGTRYTARVRHWTEAAMTKHAAMGFEPGWGAVADQLAALAEAG